MGWLYVNNKGTDTQKSKSAKTMFKHRLNPDPQWLIWQDNNEQRTYAKRKKRNLEKKTSTCKQVQMVVNSNVDASGYMPANEGK